MRRQAPHRVRDECANMTAELSPRPAGRGTLEAVGSGGVRSPAIKDMTLAGYLYKKVIDNFTAARLREFEFPRCQGRLAEHPQDQYAMSDAALLPAKVGRVRPRVRRRRRRRSELRGARGAYARSRALASQNIYAFLSTITDDPQGRRQPARPEEREGDEGGRERKSSHANRSRRPQGHAHRVSTSTFATQAERGTRPRARSIRRGGSTARARTYFESQHWMEGLRSASRRRRPLTGTRTVGISPRSSTPRVAQACSPPANPAEAPSCFDSMAQRRALFIKLYLRGANFTNNRISARRHKIQCDINTP